MSAEGAALIQKHTRIEFDSMALQQIHKFGLKIPMFVILILLANVCNKPGCKLVEMNFSACAAPSALVSFGCI
jgi:hypothetical protein